MVRETEAVGAISAIRRERRVDQYRQVQHQLENTHCVSRNTPMALQSEEYSAFEPVMRVSGSDVPPRLILRDGHDRSLEVSAWRSWIETEA